jgi:2-hydroxychromene-2-carboxylate isomerase
MRENRDAEASGTLEFWFDFASPYSYLAASRIEDLVSLTAIELVWRPFLLGPIFKQRAANASPFQEAGPDERRYRRRDVERLCELYGLPLSWPSNYPRGSLLATRVALIAAEQGWCGTFAQAVFRANFAEDRDIASERVISDVLYAIQRNPGELVAKANLSDTKTRLAVQVNQAIAKGIFGAPTCAIGAELFWGNDRLEQAIEWARRPPYTPLVESPE